MLRDASDKHLRMKTDDHLNHSQETDGDVETRRADLQLTGVKLLSKCTRTHYLLLQLRQQNNSTTSCSELCNHLRTLLQLRTWSHATQRRTKVFNDPFATCKQASETVSCLCGLILLGLQAELGRISMTLVKPEWHSPQSFVTDIGKNLDNIVWTVI